MTGTHALAGLLDRLLPQTQCRRCGYDGCRPYAQALARGEAGPDRCPPGGTETALALAATLELAPGALPAAEPPTVVAIDPAACIGCARCLRACPVDAIVGAAGVLHAVLAAECTGCNLCIAPCPVDCIAIVAAAAPVPLDIDARQRRAARHRAHLDRHATTRAARTPAQPAGASEERREYVQAAVRRVRERRARGADAPDDAS